MTIDNRKTKKTGYSATLRAIGILERVVARDEPVSLTDIVTATGLAKPTTHRMLALLEYAGLLVREPVDKSYSVGPRLAALGLDIMLNASVRSARHAILLKLVSDIGETCNLTMLDNGQIIYADRVDSAWPLKVDLKPGSHVPLYCSASGKLFLSWMPPSKRSAMLEQIALERLTDNTITDIEALETELVQTRARRVAVDNEEYLAGLVCVAVPVTLTNGRLCASVAVQAPVARLPLARALEFVPILQQAARQMAATYEPTVAGPVKADNKHSDKARKRT
jgi:IclR family acetate operon transcriptional repressor